MQLSMQITEGLSQKEGVFETDEGEQREANPAITARTAV